MRFKFWNYMKISSTLNEHYNELYKDLLRRGYIIVSNVIFLLGSNFVVEENAVYQIDVENEDSLVIMSYINTICQSFYLKETDIMIENIMAATTFMAEKGSYSTMLHIGKKKD